MTNGYRWHPDPARCAEFERVMLRAISEGQTLTTLEELLDAPESGIDPLEVIALVEGIERYGFRMEPHPREHGDLRCPRLIASQASPEARKRRLRERIAQGEGQRLEFKSTFMRCMRSLDTVQDEQTTRKLRQSVLKSICAFLNSDGGELIVGIDNKGTPLGIEHDYPLISKGKNYEDPQEMWRQELFRTIQSNFHDSNAIIPGMVLVECIEFEGRTVAWITVLRSSRVRLMRSKLGEKSSPYEAFVRREFESVWLEPQDFEQWVLDRQGRG
jgi:Putative DNA-binding domain